MAPLRPLEPVWLALVTVVALSCSGAGSTAPPPPTGSNAEAITLDQTISGTLSAGKTSVDYYFHDASKIELVIDAGVHGGDLQITLADSASDAVVLNWTVPDGSTIDRTTSTVIENTHHTYRLRLHNASSGSETFQAKIAVNPNGPDGGVPTIGIGTVVDTVLQSATDVHAYFLSVAAGDEFIVYARGLSNASSGTFVVTMYDSSTHVAAVIGGHAGDPDNESHASGRLLVSKSGLWRITVASSGGTYTGRYRLEVARINRAPESIPATIAAGDTITGESIDRVGDVDEFTMSAQAGEEYDFFFQASPGPATEALHFDIAGGVPEVTTTLSSVGSSGRKLLQTATGRIKMTTTGSFSIQIRGESDVEGLNRGPYRLYVYKVNRRPERDVVAHAIGDTIATERLGLPGDIDEFSITVPKTTLINVEAWRYNRFTKDGPLVSLIPTTGGDGYGPWQVLKTANDVYGIGSTDFPIPAGTYTLQVRNDGTGDAYVGDYRVILLPIDTLPEGRSATVVVGDTVSGRIDPEGDFDNYQLAVAKGGHYDVYFQADSAGAPWLGLYLNLGDPYGGVVTLSGRGPTLLTSSHTRRIDVDSTGIWKFSVTSDGSLVQQRGSYRFVVVPLTGAVEHHASTLSAGDSVTDEAIDDYGDLDEFTLTAPVGSEAYVYFQPTANFESERLTVQAYDLASLQILKTMESAGSVQSTGRFRIPATGKVGIRVAEFGGYSYKGPYMLRVYGVNRAPETAPSSFAIGDIVAGESVYPVGDVDEFTFNGAAGSRIRAFLDIPLGSRAVGGLRLEVSPAGSDTVLGSVQNDTSTPNLDVGTNVVTLPTTGTYVVRVFAVEERSPAAATGYRFQVRADP